MVSLFRPANLGPETPLPVSTRQEAVILPGPWLSIQRRLPRSDSPAG